MICPFLWSHPEFTNGVSSANTNRDAMPELLEPPVARARRASKSVAWNALAIGVEDARSQDSSEENDTFK